MEAARNRRPRPAVHQIKRGKAQYASGQPGLPLFDPERTLGCCRPPCTGVTGHTLCEPRSPWTLRAAWACHGRFAALQHVQRLSQQGPSSLPSCASPCGPVSLADTQNGGQTTVR
jgi:hypothetical protein